MKIKRLYSPKTILKQAKKKEETAMKTDLLKYQTSLSWLCDETHVMIGGTTGSGKSVLLNDILHDLTCYNPFEQAIILIDIKRVELARWKRFPHVVQTVTEPEQVIPCLDAVIAHMERRYKDMERRGIFQSDANYIHLVIDELAEVFRVKGAEDRIDKLLRLARAANIHLIMATQNPSRSSGIPARIWQNVTCTIGLRCKSAVESRQVIGIKGCEDLPRYGTAYVQNADGLQLVKVPYMDEKIFQIHKRMVENSFRRIYA